MTYYLTLAELDPEAPEHALRQLLDPPESDAAFDAHHRLIWTLFPGRDMGRDFLWRAHGKGKFLVLSARKPQGSRLFRPLQPMNFAPVLAVGDRLAFVLRANATKDRRSVRENDVVPGTKRRPRKDRRVDIVMHAMFTEEQKCERIESRALRRMDAAEEAAMAWLAAQGERRGFTLDTMTVEDYRVCKLGHRRGHKLTFGVLDLGGQLTVRDPARFAGALLAGFGRAKAYGCGLMLVRRL